MKSRQVNAYETWGTVRAGDRVGWHIRSGTVRSLSRRGDWIELTIEHDWGEMDGFEETIRKHANHPVFIFSRKGT